MGSKVLQMQKQRKTDIQVQFWGMSGPFSYQVLQGLLQAGTNVTAIVTPAAAGKVSADPFIYLEPQTQRSPLPVSNPYLQPSIIHTGWELNLPVLELRNLTSALTTKALASQPADIAVVACYPFRLPPPILALPSEGFLNLHPSLLPELRGPYPLFWTFRLGKQQTGLTVHYMDSDLDSGDIVLQKKILLPDGIGGPDADALLAQHGASMLALACRSLTAGVLPRYPQPEGGSYYPRPGRDDFRLPTTWPARRAYNFIRGTAEWGHPYRIVSQEIDLYIRSAITFEAEATMPQTVTRNGRDLQIRFTPGVLHAR
jgi:methionyl-tRNA formyltransferase